MMPHDANSGWRTMTSYWSATNQYKI